MKGVRYEFCETGLFCSLEDCLEGFKLTKRERVDYESAKDIFDTELPLPFELPEYKGQRLISFFTEEGISKFKKQIDTITKLLSKYPEDAGFGEMKMITIDVAPIQIIYQDKFQFLISEQDFMKIIKTN